MYHLMSIPGKKRNKNPDMFVVDKVVQKKVW